MQGDNLCTKLLFPYLHMKILKLWEIKHVFSKNQMSFKYYGQNLIIEIKEYTKMSSSVKKQACTLKTLVEEWNSHLFSQNVTLIWYLNTWVFFPRTAMKDQKIHLERYNILPKETVHTLHI